MESNKDLWTPFRRPTLFRGPEIEGWSVAVYDEQMAEVLNRYISPVQRQMIVEYGNGDGCWLEYLAFRYPLKTFVGYEWNPTLLSVAKQRCVRLKNVSFVEADISQKWHPVCDVFYAFGVLEHFEKHVFVLQNLVSGLKPKGICIVNVPSLIDTDYVYKRYGLKKEDVLKDKVVTTGYGYEEVWSPKYFSSVISQAGLCILEHWVVDRWHEHAQVIVASR